MLFILYVAPAIEYETYEVTAYTANAESTGKTPDHPAYGITASGDPVEQGVTIACPPEMAFGTAVYIPYFSDWDNGGLFECQDRGGAITAGKIDVYMADLDEAIAFGRRELDVVILNENEGELRVKIRIVKSSRPTYWYADKIGEVFDARKDVFFKVDGYRVEDCRDGTDDPGYVSVEDCVVVDGFLHSLNDLIADKMRPLEQRVQTLETELRVAREDTHVNIGKVTVKLDDFKRSSAFAEVLRKSFGKQQPTRDEIVAKAIADVAELERTGKNVGLRLPESSPFHIRFYRVDFVVNSDKRTVVALIKSSYFGDVLAKGIAKCTPTDVFNAHLGRAIALRRALGLDVPAEYLNAPQPEKARVGDVVEYDGCKVEVKPKIHGVCYDYRDSKDCAVGSLVAEYGTIIDDTASTENAAKATKAEFSR